MFAFPPCTHVAVSGARWFKDKGLGALIQALQVFDASLRLAEWGRRIVYDREPRKHRFQLLAPARLRFRPIRIWRLLKPGSRCLREQDLLVDWQWLCNAQNETRISF
jgi:hypothetical protein